MRAADAAEYARRAGAIMIDRAKRASRLTEGGATDTTRTELGQTSAFDWLLLAAWPLAEQRPDQRTALSDETFIAAQWTG